GVRQRLPQRLGIGARRFESDPNRPSLPQLVQPDDCIADLVRIPDVSWTLERPIRPTNHDIVLVFAGIDPHDGFLAHPLPPNVPSVHRLDRHGSICFPTHGMTSCYSVKQRPAVTNTAFSRHPFLCQPPRCLGHISGATP